MGVGSISVTRQMGDLQHPALYILASLKHHMLPFPTSPDIFRFFAKAKKRTQPAVFVHSRASYPAGLSMSSVLGVAS